jgi:hypothetical protein
MRPSTLSFSLLALSFLLGCSDDGTGTSATSLTSNPTTDGSATDGPDTGDGDPGDGDGDPGDGDGDPGDGDGYCAHQCTSDDDCLVDGMASGLTCIDGACSIDSPGCTSNEECVAAFSGWSTPCSSGGGECDAFGQLCIDAGGEGLCATPPSDFLACEVLMMEEIEIPDIDGNLVVVCAQTDAVCSEDAFCFVPCESDDDCSGAYPICDVGSGLCQCGSDADCATLGVSGSSVCNAGSCGCGEDQQCVDGNVGDVCTTDGYCGCSGDMACAGVSNPFDGGMISCTQP